MDCPSVVSQKVCVEAKVTVEPETKIGRVDACCVGKPRFEECGRGHCGCTYMVSQMMCVRFPLTISASAHAKPAGIVCRKARVEPCLDDEPCEMPCEQEPLCCEPMLELKSPVRNEPFEEREAFDLPAHSQSRRSVMRRCGFCFPPLPFFPCCFMRRRRRYRQPPF